MAEFQAADRDPLTGLEEVAVTARKYSKFNIDNFLADNKLGFAKSNRFLVKILNNVKPEYTIFYCESVEFPGRNFNATDMRIYGPSFKAPSLSTYSDVNLTFLCDSDLNQKV